MPSTMVEEEQIKKAIKRFKTRIKKELTKGQVRNCTFQNGGSIEGQEFYTETKNGRLSIVIPSHKWGYDDRDLFYVALNSENGRFTPNTELNIPYGLNRYIQTCLVKDGKNIMICHRGKFTVGNGSLTKQKGLEHFENKTILIDDGGKEIWVTRITKLTSKYFAEEIAEFTFEVNVLKDMHR